MVTREELKRFLPSAKAELASAVVDGWNIALAGGITTGPRIRAFLASIATETGGLTSIVENMNYTTAGRIRAVWPSRFKTESAAETFVRQPQKLAVKVYGGRMGNAAAPSQDGWLYRGGGMMQTTGRDGYRSRGFEDNPAELQTIPSAAFRSAVQEWVKRGCNELADRGDLRAIRRAINGGYNGMAEFEAYEKKARAIWTGLSGIPVKADQIRYVQTRLKALGYTEVGALDGKMGTMTRSAILAFRAENGLPLATEIDEDFLEALNEAPKRLLTDDRQAVPDAKVREKVPEVRSNFVSKVISSITAWVSGLVALLAGLGDHLGTATEYLRPVKEFTSSVPGWVWLLAVTAIAVSIYRVAKAGEKEGIEAFKTGERR